MKIIGGNFGTRGSAFISRDRKLVIEGAQRAVYSAERIAAISADVVKERRFGAFGFIVGAVLLSVLFGLLLGVLGVVIALVVAVAGSFYSDKTEVVEMSFDDQKSVRLECTPRGVKKLFRFSPQ